MKNLAIKIICITSLLILITPIFSYAANGYEPLVPDVVEGVEAQSGDFIQYARAMFTTILTIAIALSVIMFTVGGVEYIASSVPGSKGNGKSKMFAAIGGLILALTSWLILNTLNPDLLNFDINLGGRVSTGAPSIGTNYGENRDVVSGTPLDYQSIGQGVYGPVPENEFTTRERLRTESNGRITINDDDVCNNNTNKSIQQCRTYVGNLNEAQIQGVLQLSEDCNCNIVISGAGEQGGHSANSDHYHGAAIDLRSSESLNTFIREYGSNIGTFILFEEGERGEQDHWHIEF